MDNGIIITNANKLKEAIKAAEGRARTRTITPADIVEGCRMAEERMGIPRKHMDGVSISADMNAQNFAKSYSGIPESTQFVAKNVRGKWYVTHVYRDRCSGAERKVKIRLTDAAKAAVIQHIEEGYKPTWSPLTYDAAE